MKGAFVAASAASLIGAVAASHQGHVGFHNRRGIYGSAPVGTAVGTGAPYPYGEVCSVYTSTYTGEGGWVPKPTTYAANSTVYLAPSPIAAPTSSVVVVPVPTPEVTTCETPGTYTFPAKTIVVIETTTVCGAKTTVVPPGEHTYGGETTSVATETTVTLPYATTSSVGSTITSVILTTTYVCPSAGEYTFGATTSSYSETATVVYPTISTFTPGTYTHPETTVTIIKTSEIFVCPYSPSTTSSVYVAPSSSVVAYVTPSSKAVYSAPAYSAPAYSAPAPVYSAPAKPAYSAPAYSAPAKPAYSAPAYSAPAKPAYSAPAYSAPAKPSAPSVSYGGTPLHKTNGNQWAMTYTPYTESGSCKTASEVMYDIGVIKNLGFTTVRTYSTDCGGLESIGAACKEHKVLMILGVFIKDAATFESGCDEQVGDIITWGKAGNWDLVAMVVIGNEAIFHEYCTAGELAAYITKAKAKIQGAGLPSTVPFTTTDAVSAILEFGSALCDSIDVLAANVQPFFTSSVYANKAGEEVKKQLEAISVVCPGPAAKGLYNLESGWPTGGEQNGNAKPGKAEQRAAIKNIIEVCGHQSVIFSYGNDEWKAPGQFGVEQTWGCADNLAI
ncbi:glycoside hydrolase [Mytilinidion resinicola]|uniref:Probable beta-glucosidase btgE n=1 Tax=Mytilinidion resinicola TaxID=574789 RepID=A0A6A6Y019_9PEZI|nr:glycoside hydrolase [Mytilinidion resinicola]KAF2801888.1 glycoside hydrolase [Mytilinidion resinicola]